MRLWWDPTLAATLAAAAPASAATVGVAQRGEGCGQSSCAVMVQVVVISDAGAEPNRVTVEETPAGVIVRDSGAPLVAEAPCAQGADHALCPGTTSVVRVEAGGGDDTVAVSGTPSLEVEAGDGNDIVRAAGAADARVSGGAGDDVLAGTPALDVLQGGPGRDRLDGGGGDDFFYDEDANSPAADVFAGGAGHDRVLYTGRATALHVDLRRGDAPQAGEGDRLGSIEDVVGGSGDDVLIGDGRQNFLFGGAGRDRLVGNAGVDWLFGEAGADSLTGGSGGEQALRRRGGRCVVGRSGERPDRIVRRAPRNSVLRVRRRLGSPSTDSLESGPNVFEFVLAPDAGDRLENCERAQIDNVEPGDVPAVGPAVDRARGRAWNRPRAPAPVAWRHDDLREPVPGRVRPRRAHDPHR